MVVDVYWREFLGTPHPGVHVETKTTNKPFRFHYFRLTLETGSSDKNPFLPIFFTVLLNEVFVPFGTYVLINNFRLCFRFVYCLS